MGNLAIELAAFFGPAGAAASSQRRLRRNGSFYLQMLLV